MKCLVARLRNAKRITPKIPGKGKWLFCVETENPRGLQKHLKDNGVESRSIFTPLHLSPAFRPYAKGKYRVAEQVWGNHLALPTGPHVSPEQIKRIVGLVNEHKRLRGAEDCHSEQAATQ
jgi:dTDP-4-amino-4,6-dideoxygalactose transaminase